MKSTPAGNTLGLTVAPTVGLVGVLLLIPLAFMTGVQVRTWQRDAQTLSALQGGLDYTRAIRRVIEPVIAHRRWQYALAGESVSRSTNAGLEKAVDDSLAQLADTDQRVAQALNTAAAVTDLVAQWRGLKTGLANSATAAYGAKHDQFIDRLLALEKLVGNGAGFALDADPRSNHLFDVLGMRLLPMAVALGQMREFVTAMAAHDRLSAADRERLVRLMERSAGLLHLVDDELRDPAVRDNLSSAQLLATQRMYGELFQAYQQSLVDKVLGAVPTVTQQETQATSIATAPIIALFSLFDAADNTAQDILSRRRLALQGTIITTTGTTGALTILGLAIVWGVRARLIRQLARARALIESAPVAIYQTDARGRIVYANPQYRRIFHLGADDGFDEWANSVHPEDRQRMQSAWTDFCKNPRPMSFEYRGVESGGRSLTLTEQIGHAANVDGYVGTITDITELKDLATALRRSQKLTESVIADLPIAVRACDTEGRVFLQNAAAADLFALAAADGVSLEATTLQLPTTEVLLPDGKTPVPIDERPLMRALRSGIVTEMELLLVQADGVKRTTLSSARRLIDENGKCHGAVAITQDITQKKSLEVELAHAQKLESIGQLAAGIAHEINTPTQFIGDNVRFLDDSFRSFLALNDKIRNVITTAGADSELMAAIAAALDDPDMTFLRDEIPKAISQSLEGVGRISKIVGAMKEFSHPGTERTPLDLNRAIASTITVASNEWKYVAEIKTAFDATLPPVPVMPGGFNQVILNMIVNAAHAISAAAGGDSSAVKGTISITTRQAGAMVEIAISDTGCGIPAKTIPRIFDPFFTTKPIGKGTGQGLAIAHDVVVNKHGGSIAVASEPGAGTTFTLRLPMRLEPDADDAQN